MNKTFDCATTKYNFELPIKALPFRDSVQIGDTIWFEVKNSTNLKDLNSGKIVDYSGAMNLGISIAFNALSSEGEFTINSVYSFEYVIKKGIELTKGDYNGLYNQYRFSEENQYYILSLGVVPKSKGTYRIGFSNAANVARSSDKCTKAGFSLNFRETDQHYYLAPAFDPNGPALVGGDYYFKVN